MTIKEFQDAIEKEFGDYTILDIDTTGDFQCNQTGGCPTVLNVCWEKGKAWLSLIDWMMEGIEDKSYYEQGCADWGIRNCESVDDFNSLLESLGEDAYCYARHDDESEDAAECFQQSM